MILKGIDSEASKNLLGEIPEHKVGECMCGLAVTTKTALYSKDIFTDMRCTWEECKKAGLKSFAALPLFSGEEVIGVVGLSSKEERNFEPEAEFLETLSKTISIGLSNALSYTIIQETEASLKESRQQLQQIYNSAGDIIFLLEVYDEKEFSFVSMNEPGLKAIGATLEQICNKNVKDIIPQPSLDLVLSKYHQAIQTKNTIRWEEVTEYPTGVKTAIISISPIFNESGKCIQLVGTLHDITERKRAEKEIMLLNTELEKRVIERTAKLQEANKEL